MKNRRGELDLEKARGFLLSGEMDWEVMGLGGLSGCMRDGEIAFSFSLPFPVSTSRVAFWGVEAEATVRFGGSRPSIFVIPSRAEEAMCVLWE